MVLKVGLTGGIGSGKSTACNIFSELNVPIIDTDIIAAEIVRPDMPTFQQVVRIFGNDIVKTDGCLDRRKLRGNIFSNDDDRKKLENILHPVIYEEVIKNIANITTKYCIITVPLLIETNFIEIVDRVLLIDTSEELQLSRASARDHDKESNINAIINCQLPRQVRQTNSTDIINNDGNIRELHQQIYNLHEFYINM